MHDVETDIMHVTTVKAEVGRAKALFPLSDIQALAVLVVVAYHGEHRSSRRAQCLTYLSFQSRVIATVILHVVAHGYGIHGHGLRQGGYGLSHVGHCLVGETGKVTLLYRVIVGARVIRTKGIGYLWVSEDD